MLNICSIFQKFFGIIKNISKKIYRTSAVLISGAVIVSVVCFCAKDFGGSGKNIVSAEDKGNVPAEDETKTDETDVNELLQNSLFEFTENEENDYIKEKMYYIASVIDNKSEGIAFNKAATITPIDREQLGDVYGQTGNLPFVLYKESEAVNTLAESSTTDENVQMQQTTEAVEETVRQEETTQPETVQTETMQPETAQPESIREETIQPEPETAVYNSVNIEVTESDYYWLTKIVEAEAGNQDEIGKILVVNVIINRVKSGAFPDSIKSVIFQNNGRTYQFEPVKNERIYDMNPTENTIQCVNRALAGEDYSRGALYFTMKTSSRSWFNTSLTLLFVHGDHYFYTN